MRNPVRIKTRTAFTLVELLVVMAILAILVSLLVAAVFKYLELAPQTQTVNDIRQLSVAIESFKTKYNIYPPSSIYLSNSLSDYTANGQTASLSYLSAIWPRLNWNSVPPIDWSGGQGGIPAGGIILEGDQCLVFFLNGPGGVNGNGWSVNPTNPTLVTGPRVGPFFEFPLTRLGTYAHPSTSQSAAVSAMFPSFFDPYATPSIGKGQPYAFFCSGRSAGGYNPNKLLPTSAIVGDCPSLGLIPYLQTNSRFYNNNTFQIISAGKNLLFGPGGVWPNSTAAYATQGAGVDDLSNFSGDLLGVF
jgi:prepilin-type N-terminal cleavage/methylation domain-containing protein